MTDGQITVLADASGHRLTPSVVVIPDGDAAPIVGQEAMTCDLGQSEHRRLASVKRLMGRTYAEVEHILGSLCYEVISGPNGEARIRVGQRSYLPQEISAHVIRHMKHIAEAHLRTVAEMYCITVPAYFSDAQKEATRQAARLAGIAKENLRIVVEPTAAAMAYNLLHSRTTGKSLILVFDLGGGTFDVTLMQCHHEDSVFKVLNVNGDRNLGGDNFTDNLYNWVLVEARKTASLSDLAPGPSEKRRIWLACEMAKRALSTNNEATVEVVRVKDGETLRVNVTRAQFELLNERAFARCMELVQGCMRTSIPAPTKANRNAVRNLELTDITEVVCVGGSTRIPRIHELLEACFADAEIPIRSDVHVDEAVGYGASAVLKEEFEIIDCVPLPLGVELKGGLFKEIVPKGGRFPGEYTANNLCTASDSQTACVFQVFEGEGPLTAGMLQLGRLSLSGLPPKAAGAVNFSILFKVDLNGMLTVRVVDDHTNKPIQAILRRVSTGMSEDEILQIVAQAQASKAQNEQEARRIESRVALESCVSRCLALLHPGNALAGATGTKKQAIRDAVKPFADRARTEPHHDQAYWEDQLAVLQGILQGLNALPAEMGSSSNIQNPQGAAHAHDVHIQNIVSKYNGDIE